MISGAASILGLIVGFFIGAVSVASTYGEGPTFIQGVGLTLVTVLWIVLTAIAIGLEWSESL